MKPMIRRRTILVFVVMLALAVFAEKKEESLQQLIARAEAAHLQDRPSLYLQLARRQAEAAEMFYAGGNVEAGNSAVADVANYCSQASAAAIASGKKLKDTEIALRKMAERFRDLKRNLAFEDQAPVQQAIDRMETMRTDLLAAMFGKKKAKP
jgi:hypothetical protein